MELNKYEAYFKIDEGYYPETNEDSIKDPKNKWQHTFPHKEVIEVFEMVERALSRGNNPDKKSIWIDGAYGTGKSQIVWATKSLLDCSPEEFRAYFAEYDSLKNKTDLRDRLLAAKSRKIVTAYRYATGGITSTVTLIRAIFDSVEGALRRANCKYIGAKTLRGKIVAWLEADEANLQLFSAKIKNPAYRHLGSFSGKDAQYILHRLKNPDAPAEMLVDDILTLGEREGIRAFEINMDDLKDWLTEVIRANDLKAIILFWDEFSSFFANNRNNLDEFQKLVELSNAEPFYLFIATHYGGGLFDENDLTIKKLRDRFNTKEVRLPDNIAFELIGKALEIKPEAKREWKYLLQALSDRTEKARKAVVEGFKNTTTKINEDDLIKVLPIHPMAAVFLKYISSSFASNQRSMFNFIKNDEPDIDTFQTFIAKKTPHNPDFLTIDYLWDFFYEKGGGRLKESISVILDSYRTYQHSLTTNERIVLKTVLIMQAMSRGAGKDGLDLFFPTKMNLQNAFEGVDELDGARAVFVAQNLVKNGVLFVTPGRFETFAVVATSGDQTAIEQKKAEIEKHVTTLQLIESKVDGENFLEKINLSVAQRVRFQLYAATADNFTATINKLANLSGDFHIKAVVCFARNETEQSKIQKLLRESVKNNRYNKLVFIDLSANLMKIERFNRWVETSASEEYWRTKDATLASEMKNKANICLKEWQEEIFNGTSVIYHAVKSEREERAGISCLKQNDLRRELSDNVKKIYPFSFDNVGVAESLWLANYLKLGVKLGIAEEVGGLYNKFSVQALLGEVWQRKSNYWEVQPGLQISKLKVLLDGFIGARIAKDVRVSFDDIFYFLLEKGFMPYNIYALLTGFLLKEYAQEPYRYSVGADGYKGGAMTADKLAEYIAESITRVLNYKKSFAPKFIEIMSREQREFIHFSHEVFGVEENISVEQTANKLRSKINELGYPIWCYVDAAEGACKNFLQSLARVTNPKQNDNIAALAEQMGSFLLEDAARVKKLKNFVTKDTGRKSLEKFLRNLEGGIIFVLAKKIGIEDAVEDVRKKISEGGGVLHRDKETAAEAVKNLIVDYKIIAASKNFGIESNSISGCVKNWNDKTKFIRVPCKIISDRYPTIKKFFGILREIAERNKIPDDKKIIFLELLEKQAETISKAISKPQEILPEEYSNQFTGLSSNDVDIVYAKLPMDSFTDEIGVFNRNLNAIVDSLKKEQSKFKLKNLWQELTKSNSPNEWARINRTPIFLMVPDAEKGSAKKIFDAVSTQSPEEKDINFAFDYLRGKPAWLKDLNDKEKIDAAFRRSIIGNRQVLLNDVDEVRAMLESKISHDVYTLNFSERIERVVEQMAKEKYYDGGSDRVIRKVMSMSDERAKDFLIKMLKENFKVGLEVLAEEG